MSTAVLTTALPILVADRERDGDERYFAARQGGITGTEIRDWGQPAKRRAIITEKVTGEHDYRSNRYYEHGNYREPYITEWAAATHGVQHTRGLYAHPENTRFLCTPDGYLAGFTLGYEPGAEGVTVEIKTTTKNLMPGKIDAARVLIEVDPKSHFQKMKYMRQVQWQMFVMNAARCLFIWEPFDADTRDPESGHRKVTGPPEWVIIPRDQKMIDGLVAEAEEALATIDKARASNSADLPPVSDIPTEEAMLLADLFAAREQLAVAEAARVKAWEALQALYAERGEEFSEDRGFALVTYSKGKPRKSKKFDRDLAAKKAAKRLAEFDAFQARYTVEVEVPGKPSLSITDKR